MNGVTTSGSFTQTSPSSSDVIAASRILVTHGIIERRRFTGILLELGFNGGVPIDEAFYNRTISGRHNPDITADLFPDWPEDRRERFADNKEARFRALAGARSCTPTSGIRHRHVPGTDWPILTVSFVLSGQSPTGIGLWVRGAALEATPGAPAGARQLLLEIPALLRPSNGAVVLTGHPHIVFCSASAG